MPSTVRTRTRPSLAQATSPARPQGDPERRARATRKFKADDPEHMRVMREYTQSQQLVDPFRDDYGVYEGAGGSSLSIVEPPYNFYSLLRLPYESSMLMQCIAAYVTNIEGHGYRLEYVGPKGGETSREAEAEKETIENLLDFPNDDNSFQVLRDRVRFDYETFGNAYLEVGRDTTQRVTMFSHVAGHTMRVTRRDSEWTKCEVMLPRDGKLEKVKTQKRFRRYVQRVGSALVYFKEFGDPRIIDPKTGREVTDGSLAPEDSATEIIHMGQYNPIGPYGLPRWLNQLPSVLGSRQAELTNLDFFKDNAIPAMALMVSGGMVTQSTIDDIEEMFYQARGRSSMHRLLVIEASGDDSQANSEGIIPVPKIELTPLQGDRQNDGLFLKYDEACADKVRSSFRLPKLFVGLSDGYNYATAKTAYEVAESQVFGPERNHFDDIINKKIIGSYNPKYWAVRSNPPRLTDSEEILKAIDSFDKAGAITPNVAIGLANEMFDLDIAHIDEVWGDYPMALIAGAARSGNVGTAITSLAIPEGQAVPPEILVLESKNPETLQASGLDGGLLPETHVTGLGPDGQPYDPNNDYSAWGGGDVDNGSPSSTGAPKTPKSKPVKSLAPNPQAAAAAAGTAASSANGTNPKPKAGQSTSASGTKAKPQDKSQQGKGALTTTAKKEEAEIERNIVTDLLDLRRRIKEQFPEREDGKAPRARIRTRTRR